MKNVFSVLGGILAGTAIGLLFAPRSGKETREKIKAVIEEKMPNLSKERLEELVDEVLEKVTITPEAEVTAEADGDE